MNPPAHPIDPRSPAAALLLVQDRGRNLWPLATPARPKALLDLGTGDTLLRGTFERLKILLGASERLWVATDPRYATLVLQELPELPGEHLLTLQGNESRAVTRFVQALPEGLNAVALIVPTGHVIGDDRAFRRAVSTAAGLADRTGCIAVITIPGTGHDAPRGRVLPGPPFPESDRSGLPVYRPGLLLDGRDRSAPSKALCNTGIVAGRGRNLLAASRIHLQQRPGFGETVLAHWPHVALVEGAFAWEPVENWRSLERLREPSADGNTVVGRHIGLDSSGNVVFVADPGVVVVTLGIEDLLVVARGNLLLVLPKERAREVARLADVGALEA